MFQQVKEEPKFDKLWRDVQKRSQKYACPVVQERSELEHVFNLMQGCESYLEVGAAEGNSLYVLGRAVKPKGTIYYVDYGEKHTEDSRNEVIAGLKEEDYNIKFVHGDSTARETILRTIHLETLFYPDVVMIDAGHDGISVVSDALHYGKRAKKYVFFHDINIPEVAKAFAWFSQQEEQSFTASKFVNSTNYGYGILKKRTYDQEGNI